MKDWVTNNFWIKIISLIIAIITWFYVNDELDKERLISRSFYRSSFMEHMQRRPSSETIPNPMNKGYVVENK